LQSDEFKGSFQLSSIWNNTEIQNKLAFEEFRPVLKLEYQDWYPKIINDWKSEASEIIYWYRYFDKNEKKYSDLIINNNYKSFLLSPWAEKKLECSKFGYYSYIIFYKNYSSWVIYINWFNFKKWSEDKYTIGDFWEDENWNLTISSPINKENYLNILNYFNLQNQITKKNIITDDLILSFNELLCPKG
jgi:hypothetical protein